ncbi:MAG: hypothetical protein KDD66_06100 [Bdellovibrionales bacterium]|nr:hypothetical protein [Bdellovibrionales bacterium]
MSQMRIFLFSLLGFIAPVLGSVLLISTYYSDASSTRDLTAPPHDGSADDLGKGNMPKVITVGSGVAFASINSYPELDAAVDKNFLVSFLVRFDELPDTTYRHNLIAKYARNKRPYPGWAVGVHRRATSLRVEAYWRDAKGAGGWFPFDSISLTPKKWYAVSLVIQPRNSLAIYVQDVGAPFESPQSGVLSFGEKLRTNAPAKFEGGYDISEIGVPATNAELVLGATRQGKEGFRGNVALVLLARPDDLGKSVEEHVRILDGGPSHIVGKLRPEDVSLWITESGSDESRFQSKIELSGQASWQESN